jgi:hypothetical protein
MHAVVAVFSRVERRLDDQHVLHERIVPGVRQSPGFIAGYWTYDSDTGHNMLVFETRDAAQNMCASVQQNSQGQAEARASGGDRMYQQARHAHQVVPDLQILLEVGHATRGMSVTVRAAT